MRNEERDVSDDVEAWISNRFIRKERGLKSFLIGFSSVENDWTS